MKKIFLRFYWLFLLVLVFACKSSTDFVEVLPVGPGSLPKVPTSGETSAITFSNRVRKAESSAAADIYKIEFSAQLLGGGRDVAKTESAFDIAPNENIVEARQIDVQAWRPEFAKKAKAVGSISRSVQSAARSIGDIHEFWVYNDILRNSDMNPRKFILAAQGRGIKIWWDTSVIKKNANYINLASNVRTKFEDLYPFVANVFGEPVSSFFDGGEMPDKCINILFSELNPRWPQDTSYCAGYFTGADYFTSEPTSNQRKCFVMAAEIMAWRPQIIYSTLAHEFAHMCNFSKKIVEKKLAGECATWWTEMCAMVAEDIAGAKIKTPDSDMPWDFRSTDFLEINLKMDHKPYDESPVPPCQWRENSMAAYAVNYLFGAFLLRNYGGVPLFHELATSDAAPDEKSIEAALKNAGAPETKIADVKKKFYEAVLCAECSDTSGLCSFNNGASQCLNGVYYSFAPFNLWEKFRERGETGYSKFFSAEKAREKLEETLTESPYFDGTYEISYCKEGSALPNNSEYLAFDRQGNFVNLPVAPVE